MNQRTHAYVTLLSVLHARSLHTSLCQVQVRKSVVLRMTKDAPNGEAIKKEKGGAVEWDASEL